MTVAVAVAETVDYLLEQYNLPVTAAVTGAPGETVTVLETEIVTIVGAVITVVTVT